MSTTNKEDDERKDSTPKAHESTNQDDKGNNKNENPKEAEERSLVSNNPTNDTEQTTPQTDPNSTTSKARTSVDVISARLSESEKQSKAKDLLSNTTETSNGTDATTTSTTDDQRKPVPPILGKQQECNGKCHNHSDQYDLVCSNLIKPRSLAEKEPENKTATDTITNESKQQDSTLTEQNVTATGVNTDIGKCINHIDEYDFLCSNLITALRFYRKRLGHYRKSKYDNERFEYMRCNFCSTQSNS